MAGKEKCWIYVHTNNHRCTRTALRRQEKELRRVNSQWGFEIVGCSSDSGPLTKPGCFGIARAMQAAEDGKYSVLMVKGLNHISEDSHIIDAFLAWLSERGVQVCTARDGLIG